MSHSIHCLLAFAGVLMGYAVSVAEDSKARGEQKTFTQVTEFLADNCYDCHQGGASAEAGFDIEALPAPEHKDDFGKWIRIWDRVREGEMPPKDYSTPDVSQTAKFLEDLRGILLRSEAEHRQAVGRVPLRRLTHLQLERALQDLLGIDIPLADKLPAESLRDGFTTMAAGQALSHFQVQNYLSVIDLALDEALRRCRQQDDLTVKQLAAVDIVRTNPRRRTREPELLDGKAVVWSAGVTFYGRVPATTAPESGWYRFTATVSALNPPKKGGVWCTVRRGRCVSSAPSLPFVAAFEANGAPRQVEFETWLPAGHMLEIRPGDVTLKRGRFRGGQVGTGEGEPQKVAGLAIHKMTMQRVHRNASDESIQRNLFLDLPLENRGEALEVESLQPKTDAARCMQAFAERAFRFPVTNETLDPYIAEVQAAIEAGEPFVTSLVAGYRSLLCSPRFQFLRESPGRLDDYAVASRLSFLLWNSMPDATLLDLAERGQLSSPEVLHEQVDRMLCDRRGKSFISDFADQWLDLRNINFTIPDRRLYPDFDLIVQQSMLSETYAFLNYLLEHDQGVENLIDADFSFLNSRLAHYYGITGVEGDEMRHVNLGTDEKRGGLLTHGAILKVTANGTTTSPVVRGVWVADRLLGEEIPPPPANVPAIEPDIRGATTIREMIEKHRSDDSCSACHVKIDPPGFALENFDAAGQWRDHYTIMDGRRRKRGGRIKASYNLADGREFADFAEFQKLILKNPEKLAENLAAKLLIYGTGAKISFSDREPLVQIVEQTRKKNFGIRSLVKAVVSSDIFLAK